MKIKLLTGVFLFFSVLVFSQDIQVKGKVVDENGEGLPGVNVLIKGTTIGTSTDINGKYSISTSEGDAIVVFMFIGYQTIERQVSDSGVINVQMQLDSEVLKEVVLTAQAKGQKNAIREQINSKTLKNVVAQDRLQENPDANSVEAIGRLPGVSVTRDGGEGSGLVIRGLQSKYTAVTLNGVRMPSTGGDSRETNISGVSQYALQGVEVYKSLTADMDANSVAGTVNLKLRETPIGLHYNLMAQGGYNDMNEIFNNYKVQGEIGNRFLDDKLGVFVSISSERVNRSTQTMGAGYEVRKNELTEEDEFRINNTDLNLINRIKHRQSAMLSLDYKLSSNTKLGFYTMYNRSNNKDNRQTKSYLTVNSGGVNYDFTYNDGRIEEVLQSAINGETDLGLLKVDYGVSFSRGRTDDPNFRQWKYYAADAPSLIDTVFTQELRLVLHPEDVPPLYNDNGQNIDEFNLNNMRVASEFMTDENLDAYLNLQIPFKIGENTKGNIKTGYAYRSKNRLRDVSGGIVHSRTNQFFRRDIANDLPWIVVNAEEQITATGLQSGSVNDFINGKYNFGSTFDFDRLHQMTDSWEATSKYWFDQGEEVWMQEYAKNNLGFNQEIEFSVMNDQDIVEKYHAAYLMTEFNIGDWFMFLPGVRYEKTNTSMKGFITFEPTTPGPTYEDLPGRDTVATRANNFLLPMVHLRISPSKWFYTHVAYTQTLSRPIFSQITPNSYSNYNPPYVYKTQAPDLEVEQWENYDAQFTFHGQKLGLISLSGFHKKVNNQIWDRNFTRIKSDPMVDGFPDALVAVSRPENHNNEITLKGFEVEMQTSFWYMENFLKYFTVSANYTFTESKTLYPQTRIDRITVEDPNGGRPTVETIRIDTLIEGPMLFQPKHIANASLGFNRKGLNVWLSFQYNGGIFLEPNPFSSERDKIKNEFYRLDLQVSKKFSGKLQGFEIIGNFANLSDFVESVKYRGDSRPTYMENYGWTADLGIRYSF